MAKAAPRDPNSWPELQSFHKLMEDTWHPASTGDLKMARQKAPDVLEAALALRKSRGGSKCDTPEARAKFAAFIEDARSYAHAAKTGASDDAITVTLRRTHSGFESIEAPCMAMKPGGGADKA
jgi:hypothetical protein